MAETLVNIVIDDAVAEARERYVAANPKSCAAFERACRVMPGGNTRTTLFAEPFPLHLARGEGPYLWDIDGHRYIDFLGEYTAGIAGHSEPRLRAAVERALAAGINLGGHTEAEERLAAAFCARFPSVEMVRFTNSGTEANLMALGTARAVTGRTKVMAFRGAYHGGVLTFAGGVSGPLNAPFDVVLGSYNDAAATLDLVDRHQAELAAILIEPMLGSGGCIPAQREFLAALREVATRHGIVLIFDEVMTSRLGPGGLQEKLGIHADLTTFGKYLGGGMSFGAFGGRSDLMARFDPRRPEYLPHGGTFNNNVLSMAAGYVMLTEVYTPERATALNSRGDDLRERLNALAQSKGAKLQFTGRGSMMNAHFTRNPIHSPADLAGADTAARDLLFFDLLAQGIWLPRRGMVNLSLPVEDGHCATLIGAVETFLDERRTVLQ